MSLVILSPHIDDAVFSCWHLITQPDVTVVNVFAGVPPKGTNTLWDRCCGESDSAVMMQKRKKENDLVLKSRSIAFLNLDYLDRQYRLNDLDLDEIANRIHEGFKGNFEFYAPIAAGVFWRHPDHLALREVGQLLLRKGRKVSFYADIPYMQMPMDLDGGYAKRMNRRASKLLKLSLVSEITKLEPEEQELKRQAMQQYISQYKMTNLTSLKTLSRKANLAKEVTFGIKK